MRATISQERQLVSGCTTRKTAKCQPFAACTQRSMCGSYSLFCSFCRTLHKALR